MTRFHFVVNSCDVLDLVVIVAGIASPQLPCPLLGMIGVRTVRCPPYRVGLVHHKLFGWYELFHSMHDDILRTARETCHIADFLIPFPWRLQVMTHILLSSVREKVDH